MLESKTNVDPPARIHLLVAKEAPCVIVIRRKPSKVAHILKLNTLTDEMEHGSWFSGRIYESRSDVSFDGQYMIYLAMGAVGDTWNGICRPPFLRTEIDWPNIGTWHGGGLFRSPTQLELNVGRGGRDAEKAINESEADFPFSFGLLDNPGYGEDEGVLYARLERDGYKRVGPFGQERVVKKNGYSVYCDDDPGWVIRPTSAHPELRVRYRGYFSDRGRVFEWDLPEHPDLLDKHVSWATYDSLGQLVVARLGVVYRYSLSALLAHKPSAVFDLESLQRPERREKQEVVLPPIEIVTGDMTELDVRTIIMPHSESTWVRELRDLAGGYLADDLREWNPEPGEIRRTPAYYLRQHDLIHVAEPRPALGRDALRDACFSAFEAVRMGSESSVALKPIGLDAGWPLDEAMAATMEAATQYVEEEPGRRVLIVEE